MRKASGFHRHGSINSSRDPLLPEFKLKTASAASLTRSAEQPRAESRSRIRARASPDREMRVKKQKRHRKVVRFFSACFGFREPFKVLCDGTFVHHLLIHHLTPADDALSRLLGGRALLFTTRFPVSLCVFVCLSLNPSSCSPLSYTSTQVHHWRTQKPGRVPLRVS